VRRGIETRRVSERGVGLGEPERTEVDDPKPPYPVMSDDAHAHRA
jgi:hypothetical protein